MATYIVKKSVYDNATSSNKAHLKALRLSDNSIVGTTETLESDVILPNTRIKSVPETGSSSSSGSLESEWNIDEQDDLIASAMCGSWIHDTEKEDESPSASGDVVSWEDLTLGTVKDVYYMFKYFDQAPAEWRLFSGLQVNQMTITMALNSFVKMSFELMGDNNPKGVSSDPAVNAEYDPALVTKAFKTLSGYIKLGDSFDSLVALRQSPNFDLTINNNKERTDALFETEAIEMSDGDFDVSGNLEIWKADALGMSMFNNAVDGVDKCLEIAVSRDWYDTDEEVEKTTKYIIQLNAHLQNPSESKDGNKYKVAIPYSVNVENGIKFSKVVTIK